VAINKLIKSGIKDANIEGDPLKDGVATTAKFVGDSVESSEINNGTVTADDLASTLNISSKTVTLPNTSVTAGKLSNTLDLSSKTVTLPTGAVSFDREYNNIALLGFKMAVTESLTVFNLVDGIVDEFHDESGTDEAEGSNDTYCASSDCYQNITFSPFSFSAGFTTTTATEEDTSEAGTNPGNGIGTKGVFTVPTGVTSVNIQNWGAGGGAGGYTPSASTGTGGGGGYVEGTLAVTAGQTLGIFVGEGGMQGKDGVNPGTCGAGGLWGNHPTVESGSDRGGGNPNESGGPYGGGGAGGGFVTTQTTMGSQGTLFSTPISAVIAAGGGGGGNRPSFDVTGGAGGGTGGDAGGSNTEQTSAVGASGGGGDQEQGGANGTGDGREGQDGGLFYGGDSHFCGGIGGGGGGFYGGGGASYGGQSGHLAGGGGSSYFGHPQITSGSTEEGNAVAGGGTGIPNYVAGTNEGGPDGPTPTSVAPGEDGYILLTGTGCTSSTASTTIVSNAFAAGTVPTTSRIVVFEENVETPTINTDVIASISRDGGSTFTNATLTDSGYVTGSSGQRILTGQATISGQPSGQSMRWKLALANKKVKIHGVSLSWA